MIVTRVRDTENSRWPFHKFDSPSRKSASPRMSDHSDTPLSTQPEWQGSYSYIPHNEGGVFPSSFHQYRNASENPRLPLGTDGGQSSLGMQAKRQHSFPQRDNASMGTLPQSSRSPAGLESSNTSSVKAETFHSDTMATSCTPGLSMGSNTISSVSSAGQSSELQASRSVTDANSSIIHEEDEDQAGDEEMLEGEDETTAQYQTTAERMAARRKMKRFRLTHQQTRFLTSEFAKQPHPDAAHRERLSKEIPGLSPRQVQVWFQNRRAKIKRLTVDDRDRMIKMRAVPDDFDNVQALHSPYGAVHALGLPMVSPAEFSNSPYGSQMGRSSMGDLPRQREDHMSPTGLTPSFGGIAVGHSSGPSNTDLMSPLSTNSTDRYPYAHHMSPMMPGGPRSTNPFMDRHMSSDNMIQMNRQSSRPAQPGHLREAMSRSRSDSIPSPLRTSMSWKGDSMAYSMYQGQSSSPTMAERHQSAYQSEQMGATSNSGLGSFDATSTYAPDGSSTALAYSTNTNVQHPSPGRPRGRAASATLPLSMDFRTQYRQGSAIMRSPPHNNKAIAQDAPQKYGAAAMYSASYPLAPLTAPLNQTQSRFSMARPSELEYSTSQMSAPISAPSDFSQAMQTHSRRESMRDSFSGENISGYGDGHDRSEGHGQHLGSSGSMKRQRSFTLPGGDVSSSGQ